MARVPHVEREEMDAEGQEIYDRIRRDRNAANVSRQYAAMLHSPQAASCLAAMGTQVRFKSAMQENLKEVAILVVAREWNSAIEWTAHAVRAADAGVGTASIDAIHTGKAPAGLTEAEQVIVRFVQQLLRQKEVSDETFAAAHTLLGTRGVVDLTLTCSYYTAINLAQIALRPEMEPGRVSTL